MAVLKPYYENNPYPRPGETGYWPSYFRSIKKMGTSIHASTLVNGGEMNRDQLTIRGWTLETKVHWSRVFEEWRETIPQTDDPAAHVTKWDIWVQYLQSHPGTTALAGNLVDAGVLTYDDLELRDWQHNTVITWDSENCYWVSVLNSKHPQKEELVMAAPNLNTEKYTIATEATQAVGGWRGTIALFNPGDGTKIPVWESEVQETEEDAVAEARAMLEDRLVRIFDISVFLGHNVTG